MCEGANLTNTRHRLIKQISISVACDISGRDEASIEFLFNKGFIINFSLWLFSNIRELCNSVRFLLVTQKYMKLKLCPILTRIFFFSFLWQLAYSNIRVSSLHNSIWASKHCVNERWSSSSSNYYYPANCLVERLQHIIQNIFYSIWPTNSLSMLLLNCF